MARRSRRHIRVLGMVGFARLIGLVFIRHGGRFQIGENGLLYRHKMHLSIFCIYKVLFMCS